MTESPTLPKVGTRFTYKRWNSYASDAQPIETFEGVVTSSAIDDAGESVVNVSNSEGVSVTFWNSSWNYPGPLEEIEICC